jgi:hypothetical protein
MPIEASIKYDQLKTKWEIKIADLEKQIKEKTNLYESYVIRMKEIFEAETRDIIESLSKLGVVTAITTAV